MVSFGKFPADPLLNFAVERQLVDDLLIIKSERAVFSGFNNIWDYAVTLVPIEVWPELRNYLDSVVSFDRNTGYYCRALSQEFPLVDFTLIKVLTKLDQSIPRVTITTYGVDSTQKIVYFEPQLNSGDVVRVIHDAPLPETKAAAKSFLRQFHRER